eukprot:CAMPEP_0170518072 /NCGR_PEP_ID=MMETSP0209-20121228/3852_1 /TAXON_ID=665100 ORGANISM="Litonotus pictus, Strain P1" /NCGR_SAMPLE_ID=MMETSP0209 /ASSEMBLY_ACC=CAM_ASM_000301 /LENGTH=724 /DNA_ID=CAMNT_0010803501 /DNA_START=316 /DNA_END=2487 /DNA_ORIENTATION=+
MSIAISEDSKRLRSTFAVFKSAEKRFGDDENKQISVNNNTKAFISTQAKVNSCISSAFKKIRNIVFGARRIFYAKISDLEKSCTVEAVGEGKFVKDCKMSIKTARLILEIYQESTPCLMKLHNEFVMAINKSRAVISQVKECKEQGNSNIVDEEEGGRVLQYDYGNHASENLEKAQELLNNNLESIAELENLSNLEVSGDFPDIGELSNLPDIGDLSDFPKIEISELQETLEEIGEKFEESLKPIFEDLVDGHKMHKPDRGVECSLTKSVRDDRLRFLDTHQVNEELFDELLGVVEESFGELGLGKTMLDEFKKVTKQLGDHMNVCPKHVIQFDQDGKNVIPMSNDMIKIGESMVQIFGSAFSSEEAKKFKEKVSQTLSSESGYDPSCTPIIEYLNSNFDMRRNNVIAKFLRKNLDKHRDQRNFAEIPDFWYECNLEKSKLSCKCMSSEGCDGINDANYDKLDKPWAIQFDSLTVSIWKTGNNINYFSEYSIKRSKSNGDSDLSADKKFEFSFDDTKSNNFVCEQLVGCMRISNSRAKGAEEKSGCQGEMKHKCDDYLGELAEQTGSHEIIDTSFIDSNIPFDNLQIPTIEFIRLVSLYLISSDGFSYSRRPVTGFAQFIAAHDLTLNESESLRRVLQSGFDSTLEDDAEAQVEIDSEDESMEVEVEGATSTKEGNVADYEESLETQAKSFVEEDFDDINEIRLDAANSSESIYKGLMMIVIIV